MLEANVPMFRNVVLSGQIERPLIHQTCHEVGSHGPSLCASLRRSAAPVPMASWEGALSRGRGPIRNLRQRADRLHCVPTDTGWRQGEQCFTWDEADFKVKWECALQVCKELADSRPDFQGLDSGLANQTLRQLKLDGQSRKDSAKIALNAALGGVWHEARANSVFEVGDLCFRFGEAVTRT
eukprot:2211031-Amphidinium_carterae.1